MVVRSHKDLEVWQVSMELVTQVYSLTAFFPREELYGLTSQIRRSAVSIPSNIAEGRAKRTTRDFIRYVYIAYGSAAELETQLLIGKNLAYVDDEKLEPVMNDLGSVMRMLNGLIAGLKRKDSSPDPRMPIPNPHKA